MPTKIDLTGQQFGRLTVIREQKKRQNNHIIWLCQCQCGKKKFIRGGDLRSSRTRSCGCYKNERASQAAIKTHTTHGDAGKNIARLYNIWQGMKKRCSRKNNKDYGNYGGRGIKVCKQWQDYRAFRKWALANGYKEELTIDRINNDGNYTPKNCRWVTNKENARNTSMTRWITIKAETKPLVEWCELFGISYTVAHGRLARGWESEDALTRPVWK